MSDVAKSETPKVEVAAPVLPPAELKDITVEGYTFKFDTEKIDDVEVIEMVAEIEAGKVARIIDFLKFLLGDDGYSAMKNFYITRDGKFKLSIMMKMFEGIFAEFDPKG